MTLLGRTARAVALALPVLITAACQPAKPAATEAPKEAPPPPPPAPVVEQEFGSIDQEAVERTFKREGDALEVCHTEGRARVPYLAGDVKLFLRIDKKGHVRYGYFEDSSLGDRDTEKCILDALARVDFPAPIGGEAEVRHAFGWEGGQERAPAAFEPEKVTKALSSAAAVRSRVDACKRGVKGSFSVSGYVEPGTAAASGKKAKGGGKGGHFRALGVAASSADAAEKVDCLVGALRELTLPTPGSYVAKVSFRP